MDTRNFLIFLQSIHQANRNRPSPTPPQITSKVRTTLQTVRVWLLCTSGMAVRRTSAAHHIILFTPTTYLYNAKPVKTALVLGSSTADCLRGRYLWETTCHTRPIKVTHSGQPHNPFSSDEIFPFALEFPNHTLRTTCLQLSP